MPPITKDYGTPSTLADVIQQVIDAFRAMADATPIQVGKQYLESFGAGSPPKVLFVPETDGRVGPAGQMGRPASVAHGCQVFVRGREGMGDVDRFRNAELLEAKVIGCLAVAGSGRLEWRSRADASPVDVNAYGAELTFGFTFRRDVPHHAGRMTLPAADADATGPQPNIPPGTAGTVDEVNVTIDPQES